MIKTIKKISMPFVLAIVALSTLLAGCSQSAVFNPQPYVPPEYYSCVPIEPDDLLREYFGDHAEFRWLNVNAQYNDVVFIFKNILVDERMFTGLDKGFIWVDQIQCYLMNLSSMDDFKPGDKIDVVGKNAGPASRYIPGLTFNNCVVAPAGQLALPADIDASSTFAPSY
ncbi:MAG: hypothetical protein C4542_03190 [Dehalococcoidia bacterium]|nr:MAG: hypothetical protein C4542_03190 [Dehalococcoidia bacterium]